MREPYKLPSTWKWVKLGEVCEIIMGQSPPGYTYNANGEGLPFFQGKADFRELYPLPRIWCTAPIKIVQPDDILISVRAPVGPTNLVNTICCIGRGLAALRCSSLIKNLWLFYYLRFIEAELSMSGSGSTFASITKQMLAQILLPLPPIEEQERIVAKIENLMYRIVRAKRLVLETVQDADTLWQSTLREIFPSPDSPLPSTWKWVKLGEVMASIESGKRPKGGVKNIKAGIPSLGGEHLTWEGNIDFSQIRFVKEEFFEGMKKGKIRKGDILIVKDGATTGKVAYVNEEFPFDRACVNEHLFLLRCKDSMNSKFVFYMLFSIEGQKQVRQCFQGSAQGGINQGFVDSVYIPLPPVEEQELIVEYLDDIYEKVKYLKSAQEKMLEKLTLFEKSILEKAFRGEL